jgi:hypothetical protein
MSTIVIMPGGFHPFHAGHAALYQSAVEAFPGAEVFVAATNDTSTRPFPFAIKEKLAKLAGVKPGHFVQVKSPFRAEEITAKFDPAKDRLIFVRSEKDANKPPQAGGIKKDGSLAYLQPLAGQTNIRPFKEHAYMAYLPTVEFGPGMTSATEIRDAWPQLNDKRKQALVMSLYPKTQTNPKLAQTVVKLLDAAIGGQDLAEDADRAEAQADYMEGQCMILAVAINQYNPQRYPIGYIWEYNMSAGAPDMQIDDDEWNDLSPEEQQEISNDISRHSVVHAYVRDQETNEYIDARGRHKTLPNLWGRMGQTRFEEFPGTARELIDITAHGDWDEVGDQVNFKRGQPAFDSLAGPAGVKRALDYAVKYLGVVGPEQVQKPVTQGVELVDLDTDVNQNIYTLTVDGDEVSFTYWDYENNFENPNINDIYQQAKEQLGKNLSPENVKEIARAVFKSFQQGMTENQGWAATFTNEETGQMAGTPAIGGMWAGYQARENQPIDEDYIDEKWSQKYKSSINCSNPKGFSQKAHCAGRKK